MTATSITQTAEPESELSLQKSPMKKSPFARPPRCGRFFFCVVFGIKFIFGWRRPGAFLRFLRLAACGKASSNMLTGGGQTPAVISLPSPPPQSGQKATTGGAGNSQKANEFLVRGVSAHKSKCVNGTWMQCEHFDTYPIT